MRGSRWAWNQTIGELYVKTRETGLHTNDDMRPLIASAAYVSLTTSNVIETKGGNHEVLKA